MAKAGPGTAVATGGKESRAWLRSRRRSYLLAFAFVVAIKIAAVIWLLTYAGPALLHVGGD